MNNGILESKKDFSPREFLLADTVKGYLRDEGFKPHKASESHAEEWRRTRHPVETVIYAYPVSDDVLICSRNLLSKYSKCWSTEASTYSPSDLASVLKRLETWVAENPSRKLYPGLELNIGEAAPPGPDDLEATPEFDPRELLVSEKSEIEKYLSDEGFKPSPLKSGGNEWVRKTDDLMTHVWLFRDINLIQVHCRHRLSMPGQFILHSCHFNFADLSDLLPKLEAWVTAHPWDFYEHIPDWAKMNPPEDLDEEAQLLVDRCMQESSAEFNPQSYLEAANAQAVKELEKLLIYRGFKQRMPHYFELRTANFIYLVYGSPGFNTWTYRKFDRRTRHNDMVIDQRITLAQMEEIAKGLVIEEAQEPLREAESFSPRDYFLAPPTQKPFGYVLRSKLEYGGRTYYSYYTGRVDVTSPHVGNARVFKRRRTAEQWSSMEIVPVYLDPRRYGDYALDPYYVPKKLTYPKKSFEGSRAQALADRLLEAEPDFDPREYTLGGWDGALRSYLESVGFEYEPAQSTESWLWIPAEFPPGSFGYYFWVWVPRDTPGMWNFERVDSGYETVRILFQGDAQAMLAYVKDYLAKVKVNEAEEGFNARDYLTRDYDAVATHLKRLGFNHLGGRGASEVWWLSASDGYHYQVIYYSEEDMWTFSQRSKRNNLQVTAYKRGTAGQILNRVKRVFAKARVSEAQEPFNARTYFMAHANNPKKMLLAKGFKANDWGMTIWYRRVIHLNKGHKLTIRCEVKFEANRLVVLVDLNVPQEPDEPVLLDIYSVDLSQAESFMDRLLSILNRMRRIPEPTKDNCRALLVPVFGPVMEPNEWHDIIATPPHDEFSLDLDVPGLEEMPISEPELGDLDYVGESLADEIDKEAAKAEPPQSKDQKQAGNYQKGHIRLNGFDISIENAKGSTRSGKNAKGESWSVVMPAHYGYLKGTVGKDKDHLDVYIGEHPGSFLVFVVNQLKEEGGAFDEHKIFFGFQSKDEAIATYDRAFNNGLGPKLRDSVYSMTVDQFKEWVEKGDTKKPYKPLEESDRVKTVVQQLLDETGEDSKSFSSRDYFEQRTPQGQLSRLGFQPLWSDETLETWGTSVGNREPAIGAIRFKARRHNDQWQVYGSIYKSPARHASPCWIYITSVAWNPDKVWLKEVVKQVKLACLRHGGVSEAKSTKPFNAREYFQQRTPQGQLARLGFRIITENSAYQYWSTAPDETPTVGDIAFTANAKGDVWLVTGYVYKTRPLIDFPHWVWIHATEWDPEKALLWDVVENLKRICTRYGGVAESAEAFSAREYLEQGTPQGQLTKLGFKVIAQSDTFENWDRWAASASQPAKDGDVYFSAYRDDDGWALRAYMYYLDEEGNAPRWSYIAGISWDAENVSLTNAFKQLKEISRKEGYVLEAIKPFNAREYFEQGTPQRELANLGFNKRPEINRIEFWDKLPPGKVPVGSIGFTTYEERGKWFVTAFIYRMDASEGFPRWMSMYMLLWDPETGPLKDVVDKLTDICKKAGGIAESTAVFDPREYSLSTREITTQKVPQSPAWVIVSDQGGAIGYYREKDPTGIFGNQGAWTAYAGPNFDVARTFATEQECLDWIKSIKESKEGGFNPREYMVSRDPVAQLLAHGFTNDGHTIFIKRPRIIANVGDVHFLAYPESESVWVLNGYIFVKQLSGDVIQGVLDNKLAAHVIWKPEEEPLVVALDKVYTICKKQGGIVESEQGAFSAHDYFSLGTPEGALLAAGFVQQNSGPEGAQDAQHWVQASESKDFKLEAEYVDPLWMVNLLMPQGYQAGEEPRWVWVKSSLWEPEKESLRDVIDRLTFSAKARGGLAEAEEDFDPRDYLMPAKGEARAVDLSSDIWSDDNKLRKAFAWITRVGLGPKFGNMPIAYYQQDQVNAIEQLRAAAQKKAVDLGWVRMRRGSVLAYDGEKWVPIGHISLGKLVESTDFDPAAYLIGDTTVSFNAFGKRESWNWRVDPTMHIEHPKRIAYLQSAVSPRSGLESKPRFKIWAYVKYPWVKTKLVYTVNSTESRLKSNIDTALTTIDGHLEAHKTGFEAYNYFHPIRSQAWSDYIDKHAPDLETNYENITPELLVTWKGVLQGFLDEIGLTYEQTVEQGEELRVPERPRLPEAPEQESLEECLDRHGFEPLEVGRFELRLANEKLVVERTDETRCRFTVYDHKCHRTFNQQVESWQVPVLLNRQLEAEEPEAQNPFDARAYLTQNFDDAVKAYLDHEHFELLKAARFIRVWYKDFDEDRIYVAFWPPQTDSDHGRGKWGIRMTDKGPKSIQFGAAFLAQDFLGRLRFQVNLRTPGHPYYVLDPTK